MRVLLIGTGGREHALAARISQDPSVDHLTCAPGNPGMAAHGEIRDVTADDPEAVAGLAAEIRADLVVIGPEAPLVAGVADAVRRTGIACFGPSAAAAQLEGSKSFAKQVMKAAGVPTARGLTCHTPEAVAAALDGFDPPYVVKDDGLAGGKGVVVTSDRAAALAHARGCGSVVVEEYLDGPEVSLFVVTDGETAIPLLPAQDFKRLGEDGTGPNTGGMGAYTPLPWAHEDLVDTVLDTVARPTLTQLRHRGTPFNGVLYCGLALTSNGPKVIEFNCRFGDPEIQAVLALLDTPLAGLLDAAARGQLAEYPPLRWRDGAAVCVVVASPGYPGKAVTGLPIHGAENAGVLHAGTARDGDGRLVSSGGRVLDCVATGPDLNAARAAAYDLVDGVELEGAQVRRDIARDAAESVVTGP